MQQCDNNEVPGKKKFSLPGISAGKHTKNIQKKNGETCFYLLASNERNTTLLWPGHAENACIQYQQKPNDSSPPLS